MVRFDSVPVRVLGPLRFIAIKGDGAWQPGKTGTSFGHPQWVSWPEGARGRNARVHIAIVEMKGLIVRSSRIIKDGPAHHNIRTQKGKQ